MDNKDFKFTKIIEGNQENAEIVAQLMYRAFDEFAFTMFGTKNEQKILNYFKKLWLHPKNRMSSHLAYVAVEDNKPIALLSAYDGELTDKLFIRSIITILKMRPALLIYILLHPLELYYLIKAKEALKDEYYIFMLSVLPEYQNRGIGTQLIRFAEYQAKLKNYKKVSLLARIKNESAIRFYKRNGYKIVETYNKRPLENYKFLKQL